MPAAKVITPEDQHREAEAAQAKAIASHKGYLILAPIYGKKNDKGQLLTDFVPLDRMHIHPHIIPDKSRKGFREVKGGVIDFVGGKGYTDNDDWANWIAVEHGEKEWMDAAQKAECYKVVRVNEDNSTDYIVKLNQLEAAVLSAGK